MSSVRRLTLAELAPGAAGAPRRSRPEPEVFQPDLKLHPDDTGLHAAHGGPVTWDMIEDMLEEAERRTHAARVADFREWLGAQGWTLEELLQRPREEQGAAEADWMAESSSDRPWLWDPYNGLPDHGETYFPSGSNETGYMMGFLREGMNVGFSINELTPKAWGIPTICAENQGVGKVFIDTGAFGEITPGTFDVKKAITHDEWLRRLALEEQVVTCSAQTSRRAVGALYIVAPDKVTYQRETLERLFAYRSWVQRFKAAGANILLPMQLADHPTPQGGPIGPGALGAQAFYEKALQVLQLPAAGGMVIPAFPSVRGATPSEVIVDFVAAVHPPAIHLLGLGPASDRFPELLRSLARVSPETVVYGDSVRVTALFVRAGSRPRAGTVEQDRARTRRGYTLKQAQKREIPSEDVQAIKEDAIRAVMAREYKERLAALYLSGWRGPAWAPPVE